MTYRQRLFLLAVIDTCLLTFVLLTSWLLVTNDIYTIPSTIIISSFAIILSHHLYSFIWKLYKKTWEYASVGELIIIVKVAFFSMLIGFVMQQVLMGEIYYRFLIVAMVLHILLIGASRFIWRIYRDVLFRNKANKSRTLIIGAGSAGTMVARQLLNNKKSQLSPVAFIDDDVTKQNLDILGISVVGGVNNIQKVVQDLEVDNIIIAIPSLQKKELNTIFQECAKTKIKTKILPLLEDLVTGKISINEFREVEIEDLLARKPIHLDVDSISENITDKVILVTGAGGSIGSEIVRQISMFNPKQIILLGHGENSIYTIEMELKETYCNTNIEYRTEIADIQDIEKMMNVMDVYHPDVVYHAAAHKHVPLMERHPEEGVKNNMIGTMNVARAADKNNVDTFVMVSTDKAVNSTSVMGATKKIAEMIIQNIDKNSQTKFVTVRFGNVLGSEGSVIPLFKKQIRRGGPVTITHPEMVRYFMTIPEASKLVVQAGALANGGEIFVLDMGEPVKIVDLAKTLIRLSGCSIEEIGLKVTGIRPGEKLFEELLDKNEIVDQQLYPNIYIGRTTDLYWDDMEVMITNFREMGRNELRENLLYLANNGVMKQEIVQSVLSVQN